MHYELINKFVQPENKDINIDVSIQHENSSSFRKLLYL